MRHRVEGRKLKRTHSHRKALLRGLATQLLRHKRIKTTEAKAKETRRYAEAIITRAKRAYLAEQAGAPVNVHARRVVARDVNDPQVVQELFSEIVHAVLTRLMLNTASFAVNGLSLVNFALATRSNVYVLRSGETVHDFASDGRILPESSCLTSVS